MEKIEHTSTELTMRLKTAFRRALEAVPMVVAVVEPDRLSALVHTDIEDEGTLVISDEFSSAGGGVSDCIVECYS